MALCTDYLNADSITSYQDYTNLEENVTKDDADKVYSAMLKQCKALFINRSASKRKINNMLNNLDNLVHDLNVSALKSKIGTLSELMNDIEGLNKVILDKFININLPDINMSVFNFEVDQQFNFSDNIKTKISDLESLINNSESNPSGAINIAERPVAVTRMKAPDIKCISFSGEPTEDYQRFWQIFDTAICSNNDLNDADKLLHLNTNLTGYAAKLIKNLSITNDNFLKAKEILDKEFLDIPFIINSIFEKILNINLNINNNLGDLRKNLNDLRTYLHDIKQHDLDFFDEQSSGGKLLGHILAKKLPKAFKIELNRRTNVLYPSAIHIIDNFSDIIKSMETNISTGNNFNFKCGNSKQSNGRNSFKGNKISSYRNNNIHNSGSNNRPTLTNFKTESNPSSNLKNITNFVKFPCKLCSSKHRVYHCSEFDTLEKRLSRCKNLNLCEHCLSSLHASTSCPGNNGQLTQPCYTCKQFTHVQAVCPQFFTSFNSRTLNNLCFTASSQTLHQLLLPLIEICIGRGKRKRRVLCLADSGSERSYFSSHLLESLGIDHAIGSRKFDIKTFLGTQQRNFNECMVDVYVIPRIRCEIPVLFDSSLDLDFSMNGLPEAMTNIQAQGYNLGCSALRDCSSNRIENIHGLLGIDILQFLPKWNLIPCAGGFAFESIYGVHPTGNIKNFLSSEQIRNLFSRPPIISDSDSSSTDNREEMFLNTLMSPQPSYFDPIAAVQQSDDAFMELGLEHLFSLESIGLPSNPDLSTLDEQMICQLRESIQLIDGKYHVSLPWIPDLITQVPSNHKIALKFLFKVYADMKQKNILSDYLKYLNEMLEEGIIEECNIKQSDYHKYNFLTHRAVVKDSVISSSKIRPVFNASLKVGNSVSLNQAAYGGIDLLNSLLKLLLQFRMNKFVFISDIRRAYLSVKLKLTSDRNHLMFFSLENGKVKTYRFASLPFGYKPSSFILNFIIKHHASTYPEDLCSHVLKNCFYSDNLIYSSNCPDTLSDLYSLCCERMSEAGFCLRSWFTNLPTLTEQIARDKKGTEHTEPFEKVLGYLYFPSTDMMQLSDFHLNENANTKRTILSQSNSIFDPLSIFTPITIRTKKLIRKLWIEGYDWDTPISEQLCQEWQKIAADLKHIKNFDFPRCTVFGNPNHTKNISLKVFCDASSSCYATSIYVHSSQGSNLIFTKAKVAPNKGLTVPTLELLAIFLSFKCLTSVLDSFPSDYNITSIDIFSDSQLCLGWLLSDNLKTQKIFVRNRIQEIHHLKKSIIEKYELDIFFHYVSSGDNSADLCTRGLSFSEFQSNFDFYLHGPSWLNLEQYLWPKYPLKCLSEDSKQKISTNMLTFLKETSTSCNSNLEPILDLYKFSNYHKLLKITSLVFQFVNFSRGKRADVDFYNQSKLYWITQMQSVCFSDEIDFLKKPDKKQIPHLVDHLNLFLDPNNVLRCKGRLGRCNYFNYDVLNPILLSKNHHFTKLYIMYAHEQCKHLGINSTLNLIRMNGYWITRSRQAIKNVIANCSLCKKFNSLSFKYPKLTNMPSHAMKLVRPFSSLGLDFTGHLFIQDENGKSSKYYILLYTCLTIRAVYFDLLPSMSTQHILLSLERFCNLYGVPDDIYSDNFSSFIQSGNILHNSFLSSDFQTFFEKSNIRWIRIPIRAAWIGVFWERQVSSLKKLLYKAIGRQKLSFYQMITVLSSIARALNDRPLTYRYSDVNEFAPLTPNCFLRLHRNKNLIFNESQTPNPPKGLPGHNELNESLTIQYELYEEFKTLWKEDYLLSLRELSRKLYQSDFSNKIKVGDIVILKDDRRPRPFWHLVRVVEIIFGNDGLIRSCRVIRKSNDTPTLHPINHLYPLELSLSHSGNKQSQPDQPIPSVSDLPDNSTQPSDLPTSTSFSDDENSDSNSFLGFTPSDQNTFLGFPSQTEIAAENLLRN